MAPSLECTAVFHMAESNIDVHVHLQSANSSRINAFQPRHKDSKALFYSHTFQTHLSITTTSDTTVEVSGSPMDIDTDPLFILPSSKCDRSGACGSPMDLDPPSSSSWPYCVEKR
jgi:hypothetical protein